MEILIKSAKIIDANSKHHLTTKDILIKNKKIVEIAESIKNTTVKLIEHDNLHVSVGFADINANFKDPGFEYKETIESGSRAALKGGFTDVAIMPTTNPVIDNKSQVLYLVNKAKNVAVNLWPIGALSQNREGNHLAELYDMQLSGAIAFSDGKKNINDAGLLTRALMYVKSFNGKIIVFCNDPSVALTAKVNEGDVATSLGLKGIPALAEELMVARNIQIAEYTQSSLHFTCISTKGSVELVRQAKKKGVAITCDVAAHQLLLTDQHLTSFDSNYKVMPPLRTEDDRQALIAGIVDGTIDAVCSDHTPEDVENKNKEFELAAYGIIGLETAFAALHTALHKLLPIEKIIALITNNPRKVLGLKQTSIDVEQATSLTLFSPTANWTFEQKDIQSLSNNTPFVNYQFNGKVLDTIVAN